MCKCSLVIFFKHAQAFPQFSFYWKLHVLAEGVLGVTESGTQVWEAGCFAHLFNDSANIDLKHELGSQTDLGLTLGSIAYWLHVLEQVIYHT